MYKTIILCLAFILLNACATPTVNTPTTYHHNVEGIRKSMVKSKIADSKRKDRRLLDIYYPIIQNTSQELCDKKLTPDIGIRFTQFRRPIKWLSSKEELQAFEDVKEAYKQKEDVVFVRLVIKGSAAEKAGIKEGDVLLSIYGVPSPNGSEKAVEKIDETILKNSKDGGNATIEVQRGDTQVLSFDFAPDMVCGYPIFIDTADVNINAYADSENIIITGPMFDKVDDFNLAAIIGHELAHNTLGHSNSKQTNAMLGAAAGALIDTMLESDTYSSTLAGFSMGAIAYSVEFENEADYVMTYYLARAGYDYHKAKDMGKFLANLNYGSMYDKASTHPQPQYRYALIKEAATEIDTKKAFGEPILPDFKKTNKYLRAQR